MLRKQFSVVTSLLAALTTGSVLANNTSLLQGLEKSCNSWDIYALPQHKLMLSNNTWGAKTMRSQRWSQCIHASPAAGGRYQLPVGWSYNWLARSDGEQAAVKAYPEVIYGNKYGNEISGSKATTGLPVRLDQLPKIEVTYAYREQGSANREVNVAAESFIHADCDITGPGNKAGDNRVYEMMVWVQAGDKYPYDSPLTMAVIDDQLWYVFADPARSSSYIAFILEDTQTAGTLDWNAFLEWTRANAPLIGLDAFQPQWCLGAVEFGSEIWWGQGELLLQQFDVELQP